MIAAKRKRFGENNGVDPELAAKLAKVSMQSITDPGSNNFGHYRERNDFSSMDGMSDLMRRSEDERRERPSIYQDTRNEDFRSIQDRFQKQYYTWEDLLFQMQKPGQSKPGEDAKVSFADFERLIANTYKSNNFSQTQLRNVF